MSILNLINKYELLSYSSRVSNLKSKYPHLEKEIDFLSTQDPSANNKYLDYIIKLLSDKVASQEELIEIMKLFHKYHSRLQNQDINQYSFDQLKKILFSIKNSNVKTRQDKKNVKLSGSEKIYEDEQVLVLKIKNKESACLYGAGTQWCITEEGESGDEYFNNYRDKNVLFYFLLRKDMGFSDPLYKICILIYKNNMEWDYRDAQDHYMDESSATYDMINPIKKWKQIKKLIELNALQTKIAFIINSQKYNK